MTARAAAEPIAIVGMSCRFPQAGSIGAFWGLLEGGVDAISEVPRERWDAAALFSSTPRTPGKICTRWGGFLEDVHSFDPNFFKIMPIEAPRIDPQHRLVMEVAWEALESAGIDPASLAYGQTGVFIGLSHSDHDRLLYQDRKRIDGYNGPNTYHCFAANRVSYFLNLRGPSMTIDSACSSALVSVHLACQSLRTGESDVALAGGVNLNLTPDEFIALSFLGVLSPDGHCRTFDSQASGYGRGEGCGVVVLKRLGDAIEGGDTVMAVIRGSAVNQDGLSNGITAPNGAAQEAVVRRALLNAGVDSEEVTWIEGHGTATVMGDRVELGALQATYSSRPPGGQARWLSSVKTNIGHLEAASGVAALIKAVLCLQQRQMVPHLHFENWNTHMGSEHARFRIPLRNESWDAVNGRRLAGVSAFGFGGTNAHLIVEEAPRIIPKTDTGRGPLHVLTLAARSQPALRDMASRYLEFFDSNPASSIADSCYTTNVGRQHFDHRIAAVAGDGPGLSKQLRGFLRGELAPGLYEGKATRAARSETAPPDVDTPEALSEMWVRGVPVNWKKWKQQYPLSRVQLPTYPFQRQRYRLV
jgi:acyl transferase domain-containing protein